MARFRVDDVNPAEQRLPTRPLGALFPDAIAVADPHVAVVEPTGTHALLGAVGLAFAQHRPLVLSPDAVWLTIAQGVAQHVRLNAEVLRSRLVRHAGKKRLTVELQRQMPTDAASWHDAVSAFRAQLAAEIGEGRARMFECDFSTSTDIDKVASQVVLLDAYSPYFSLWMTCVCGIPSVTLTGTVDDWRRIRERIDVVAEFDLHTWCKSLAPIADHFVCAAAGDADVKFWQRIYNPVDAYGGEVITGWITRFFPYLKVGGVVGHPNPMLDLPLGEPKNLPPSDGFYSGPGLRSDAVPDTLSQASVHVVDHVAGAQRKVTLHAGVVAVAQDDDGALRPIAGWHLERSTVNIAEVVDRIIAEHATTPAKGRHFDGPAEMIAIYSRIRSASLFGGVWNLVPPAHYHWFAVEDFYVQPLFELVDGRSVCCAVNHMRGAVHWIVGRVRADKLVDDPSQVRVLGSSLAAILDGTLDSNGEVDHLEVGRLDALLRAR